MIRMRLLWRAFVRLLIVCLAAIAAGLLYLAIMPGALQDLYLAVSGNAEIPVFGEIPAPPVIEAPRGELPRGVLAYSGLIGSDSFACGFLLELEDGQHVGVSAAHATRTMDLGEQAEFISPGGDLRVRLERQVRRGQPFYREHFTMDYVIWSVVEDAFPGSFLQPDVRGQAQPGERVRVFGPSIDAKNRPLNWPGVVMKVDPEATWIQLDASFDPRGYSGCPVVSEYTGRLVGMAVAGSNRPPVVMGLHPVESLVKLAEEALAGTSKGIQ